MVEKEVVQIVALHLLGGAKDWWLNHMEHAKVTKYSYFFHKLRKKFDVKKTRMCHKETFPKETKEDVNLVTLGKRSPFSLPATKDLACREEALAYLQGSLGFLTYGVPCMNQEMHEE